MTLHYFISEGKCTIKKKKYGLFAILYCIFYKDQLEARIICPEISGEASDFFA
jgi:hypothetical protein